MRKGIIVILHLCFWLIIITESTIRYTPVFEAEYGFWFVVLKQVSFFSVIAILFYINYSFLTPRYLAGKRYFLFFTGIIITMGLTLALILVQGKFISFVAGSDYFINANIKHLQFNTIYFFLYVLISSGFRFLADWFKNQKLQEELQEIKTQSEMQMLKMQINPHFLFNSLNNIYSLVKRKSEMAPDAVLMLSDIMRYMLSEVKNEEVNLNKEVAYLKNYVDLQKLRLTDAAKVDFKVNEFSNSIMIAPLLFISFIENAFKHGDTYSSEACIYISLFVKDNQLEFQCKNLIKPIKKDVVSGIGVSSTKRRLELLYPGTHSLDITSTKTEYHVNLKIQLNDT